MDLKKIAIVGGGTAGWLVANHLGKSLFNRDVSISLIESPDIPTIGVGEGTVPMMRESLKHFGISESEFIQKCDVSFKQSIKFVNWLDKDNHGVNNSYHHLFDYPFPNNQDLTPYWLEQEKDLPFADTVSFQGKVCDEKRAPKYITSPEYSGETTYAYHLDAKKFAELLRKNAVDKLKIEHLIANVTDVELDEKNKISSLKTDAYGQQEYDFYIDCTGFSCYLLGQKLSVPFIDLKDKLPIDKAITAQIPTEQDVEIPPYTIATAHEAGWIWDIALQSRRGTGFVYCSKYLTDEQAKAKFERYLGCSLDSVTSRTIPMNVGYREQFWKSNCVAIGLSQGFVEPLEATAILVTDFCARLLADRFPYTYEQCVTQETIFNRNVKYAWNRVIDFIQLHYFLSDRNDSQFWQDWKSDMRLSTQLKEKLAVWAVQPPLATDFFSKFEVFHVENYLYVLYGMKFKTSQSELTGLKEVQLLAENVKAHSHYLSEKLPSHRELLNKIAKFGLSQV